MSYMTGNLQSPRQSKFKEDFSPEEPIVADEDGLYPLNGLIAGTPSQVIEDSHWTQVSLVRHGWAEAVHRGCWIHPSA
uniref:Uncharacterized protein n=1 Tax=Bionectria ochroleuca TaxID=29856 RepID=A0A0B7KMJ5_BIOOC